jgi:imidazole glycerol phosphate synthase subunit HisF
MYPSEQLKLIVKWLRDRSSVSIFDLIDAGAVVIRFINDQFRATGADEATFMSSSARTLTKEQLIEALEKAAEQGDECGIMPFTGPGAVAGVGAFDGKSILKTLIPILLSLLS